MSPRPFLEQGMNAGDAFQLSWFAMGTEWQLTLHSDRSEAYLRSVAEAVEQEVESVEQLLSFYRESSDLSELNAAGATGAVPVDPRLFRLLERSHELNAATDGGFDPTIGPLLRSWGFVGSSGSMPSPGELERARAVVGMSHVELDPAANTVRYNRDGVRASSLGGGSVDGAATAARLGLPGSGVACPKVGETANRMNGRNFDRIMNISPSRS